MAINKLVRDRVKPLAGERAMISSLGLHRMALISKLHEEVSEIERKPTDVTEYADVVACILDLAALNGIEADDIFEAEQNKRMLKSGFSKGLFITAAKVKR